MSVAFGISTRVLADSAGEVVVVPYASHELSAGEQRVSDLVESALHKQFTRVVSMHDARDRVQAVSRPPVVFDDSDLDVVAREAKAAIEHAAFGRSEAAQRSVQAVISRAEPALESLNRETKAARNVLDACLALVRDAITRGQRRDALAHAMRCRRLVPDVSPSEMYHPTSVIGVLAEADDQLRRLRIGRLRVNSEPDSGCAVYVNGRHLGVTPFQLERAAAGEYRVQVECGRAAGRVHLVQLGDEPVVLDVDAEFDRALRSADRVALVYALDPIPTRVVAKHAARLGQLVSTREVLLLHVDGASALLRRVRSDDAAVLGQVSFSWLRVDDADNPELSRAIERLYQGRFDEPQAEPVTAAEPAVLEASATAPEAPATTHAALPRAAATERALPPRASFDRPGVILASTFAGVGLGALAAGVAFEVRRAHSESRLAHRTEPSGPAVEREREKYRTAAALSWVGVVGGGLLTLAVPMLYVSMEQPARPPAWSYAIGVAALGLVAGGGYELGRSQHCRLDIRAQGCDTVHDTRHLGGILLAAGAPLLSLSLAHIIGDRPSRASRAQVQVVPTATSLAVLVRKELW